MGGMRLSKLPNHDMLTIPTVFMWGMPATVSKLVLDLEHGGGGNGNCIGRQHFPGTWRKPYVRSILRGHPVNLGSE